MKWRICRRHPMPSGFSHPSASGMTFCAFERAKESRLERGRNQDVSREEVVGEMARLESELVIIYPMMSEDTVKLIEGENKITFIVNGKATKNDVKRAVEELYEVNVSRVFTLTTPEGKKKAYVKLNPESKASDLAVKLGIL